MSGMTINAPINVTINNDASDILDYEAMYEVTTGTTADNSELTLSTGALTNNGITQGREGDAISILTQFQFDSPACQIRINSTILKKNISILSLQDFEVEFVSEGIIRIIRQLDIGDTIFIHRRIKT